MSDKPRDILLEYAKKAAFLLLDRLGEASVESVFIGGSTARGEIAWFGGKDCVEIYSDLDLYVVVSTKTDLEMARSTARDIASRLSGVGDGYKIFPPTDIGVYTWKDLREQPVRPGTVELSEAIPLYRGTGEQEAVLRGFGTLPVREEESLYLLENRMLEEMALYREGARQGTPGEDRFEYYRALKAAMDVASAVLILDGLFEPKRADRLETLEERNRVLRASLEVDELELVRYAFAEAKSLPQAFDRKSDRFKEIVEAVWKLVPEIWCRMAGVLYGGRSDISTLVRMRAASRGRLRNLRESLFIARKLGVAGRRAVWQWIKASDLVPTAALRLMGLWRLLEGEGELVWLEEYVTGLADLCRQPVGRLESRAYGLLRAMG